MLFYHFDLLNNFIKSDVIHNLIAEKETIKKISNLYINKKINILSITTNILELSNTIDKDRTEKFYEIMIQLKDLLEKITAIQELSSRLEKDLKETLSFYDKSIENYQEEIKANLVEYNKKRDELSYKILEFETVNTTVLNSSIILATNVSNKKIKRKLNPISNSIRKKEKNRIDINLEPHDNNTLIISEKEQKAYLPFFYKEVKDIFQNSTLPYKTLQDVINDLYVVPLDKFKNSALARFKESFSLIRNKEKNSIRKAIDLGLELMFKYELSPIIIAACRNLEELDIYLDCLEENDLFDFPCFEIKFEVMPQLAKN